MIKLFKHQQELFDQTKDTPGYAVLWEMRVGKTYPTIATANHLYEQGKIDAVLLLAPNGVHQNWARVDIPRFLQIENPNQKRSDLILEWASNKSKSAQFTKRMEGGMANLVGLVWLCVNVEALAFGSNKEKRKKKNSPLESYLERFLENHKVMLICDESHHLKNPKAQRTKTVIRYSKLCPYKRILSGTPVTQGPFDLWSQFHILDPSILGDTFSPFKQRYGVFKTVRFGGPAFQQLVEYKDLDHLRDRIKPHSSRLTAKEVVKDMPAVLYRTQFYEMPPNHRRMYEELRDNLITRLDNGEQLSTEQAVVNLIRLQQISRGFVGGTEEGIVALEGPHPSITALVDLVEQIQGKVVVWCKFKPEVTQILEAFEKAKISAVRFDGNVPQSQRPDILKKFQEDPNVKALVGTASTGGEGRDMAVAHTMIYYSVLNKLKDRLQSWFRIQGTNQKEKSILYIDFVADDTTDLASLNSLANKEDIASTLTGDKLRGILKGSFNHELQKLAMCDAMDLFKNILEDDK